MKLIVLFVCVVVATTTDMFEDLITIPNVYDAVNASITKVTEETSPHSALPPTSAAAPSSDIVAPTDPSVNVKPNLTLTIQPCE